MKSGTIEFKPMDKSINAMFCIIFIGPKNTPVLSMYLHTQFLNIKLQRR